MKAIIVEDEQIAALNLKRLLAEAEPDIEIVATLQSIEETVEYFSTLDNNSDADSAKRPEGYPDIVFMDIHLADGLAFHIFDSVTIQCPIVFTTAYDQYALDAFKVNSIDYLLKPISKEDLARALAKYKHLGQHATDGNRQADTTYNSLSHDIIASMMEMIQQRKYKSHFLIPIRDKLVPLPVSSIAYIYVDDKISRIVSFNGQSHPLDKPLDTIYAQLDPQHFFRANRQYIISHNAVKDISVWPFSKLHITLTVPTPDKVIVSRGRASEFKDWYTA